jgi:hypothetical protein
VLRLVRWYVDISGVTKREGKEDAQVKSEKLLRPKKEGGLGFKNIHLFKLSVVETKLASHLESRLIVCQILKSQILFRENYKNSLGFLFAHLQKLIVQSKTCRF